MRALRIEILGLQELRKMGGGGGGFSNLGIRAAGFRVEECRVRGVGFAVYGTCRDDNLEP